MAAECLADAVCRKHAHGHSDHTETARQIRRLPYVKAGDVTDHTELVAKLSGQLGGAQPRLPPQCLPDPGGGFLLDGWFAAADDGGHRRSARPTASLAEYERRRDVCPASRPCCEGRQTCRFLARFSADTVA
jgi:hypothetical protein